MKNVRDKRAVITGGGALPGDEQRNAAAVGRYLYAA